MSTKQASTDIISVGSYLDRLNATLKTERARIVGEVSGVQMYEGRSYLYFSIKDTKDQSTIKCFMWKNDFRLSGVKLADGMEVIVTAYPAVYKPNGSISLQVELVELVGDGALKLAYDELKKKLEAEGLFAESRKREIPDYPTRIGVITSKSGAVIGDFLTNIGKFGFEIFFADSKVEGQDAIKDLLLAVETFRGKDIEVLVLMRGGGSLESFLAFNNETLVRKIAAFPVPVLTGIGHDKDISLVSLVSDKNVSTPTAVAALLNASWNQALSSVRLSEEKIFSQFQSGLQTKQFFVENSQVAIERRFVTLFETFRKAERVLLATLARIESGITRNFDAVSYQAKAIVQGFETMMSRVETIFLQQAKTLELSSPERQLAHGYSIVKSGGKVVRRVADAPRGTELDILVSDGIIRSKII